MSLDQLQLNCPDVLGGTAEAPRLIGNRCTDCGEPFFPAAMGCTRCSSQSLEPVDLGDKGQLWTFTIQGFRPKPPYDGDDSEGGFLPFAVGYVEMAGGLKVEGRIVTDRPERLRIEQPMRVCLEAYRHEAGTPVYTYAFSPDAA